MLQAHVDTRFGPLCVTEQNGALLRLTWEHCDAPADTPLLREAIAQLSAYDAGTLRQFDLPLVVNATEAVQKTCDVMQTIPYGRTLTYGDIAKQTGLSAQSVGQACGRNPIPIIIPCHRVMGAGGRLVGFSGQGGVETKVALLRHENAGGFLL